MNLPKNLSPSLPALSPDLFANSPTAQTFAVFAFFFFFIVLMAMGRRMLIHTHLRGVWAGFLMGVLVIGAVEGGYYWATQNLLEGEESQILPPNIRAILAGSQHQVNQVLGTKAEKEIPSAQSVVADFYVLPQLDAELARNSICKIQ